MKGPPPVAAMMAALGWLAVGAGGMAAFDRVADYGRTGAPALPPLTIAYAPQEDLERLDVALIDGVRSAIDGAAYVLTDRAVARALERAARRGVRVRIALDPEAAQVDGGELLPALAATANVEVREKPPGGGLMHLKAYAIDGATLRLGSANFSRSGETRQDNELSIVRDVREAARFETAFEAIWRQAKWAFRFKGLKSAFMVIC